MSAALRYCRLIVDDFLTAVTTLISHAVDLALLVRRTGNLARERLVREERAPTDVLPTLLEPGDSLIPY